MIMILCFLDLPEFFREHPAADEDGTTVSVVISSAFSTRDHLEKIQERFASHTMGRGRRGPENNSTPALPWTWLS